MKSHYKLAVEFAQDVANDVFTDQEMGIQRRLSDADFIALAQVYATLAVAEAIADLSLTVDGGR